MRLNSIKNKFLISGGLMLLLMFIHFSAVVTSCELQVTNNPEAVSAFNG